MHDYRTRIAWLTLQQEVIERQDEWESIEVGLFMHTKNIAGMRIRYADVQNVLQIVAGIGATSQKLLASDATGEIGAFRDEEAMQVALSAWIKRQKESRVNQTHTASSGASAA